MCQAAQLHLPRWWRAGRAPALLLLLLSRSFSAANNDASVFVTSLSNLWRGSESLRFRTTYAGGTVLQGFICSDLIEIGGYGSLAPFGCITSKTGVLDGEGIAGFGPAPARTAGAPPPLPPFFLSLANVTGDHGSEGVPVPHPSFSFLTSDSGAELQLGGVDPAAVQGEVFHYTSLDPHSYSIPVQALSLGNHQLLQFSPAAAGFALIAADLSALCFVPQLTPTPAPLTQLCCAAASVRSTDNASGASSIPAVLDSGTTCMCIPDSLRGGQLAASPYRALQDRFDAAAPSLPDHPLKLHFPRGLTVTVPPAVWHRDVRQVAGCISSHCPQDRLVLGDWVFRSAVVTFQWARHPEDDDAVTGAPSVLPRVHIARRQPSYQLQSPDGPAKVVGSVQRHQVVRKVSLVDENRLTFLVPTDIGMPPQRFHLVFDTGSSFFGVNTRPLSIVKRQREVEQRRLEAKDEARQRVFKLSVAMHRGEDSESDGVDVGRRPGGPPWWAGVLVALIGVLFFLLALVMALARRRMQRGGGGKAKGSFAAFAAP